MRLGPGNENERAHLLPLIDGLLNHGYTPTQVWADRGYCSDPLRAQITERGITPMISRRRRPGDPIDPNHARPGRRGRRKITKTRDPLGRDRWVIERTNAWIRRFRRLTIRHEPNSQTYLAYLTLALLIILSRAL